jgi:dTDP-4-dehydrorhamnose 3,5-epimerase-like enzyme
MNDEMTKTTGPIVCLPIPFEDARGIIQTLVIGDIGSIQVITSKAGTIRANHYHKSDSHYMFVLKGSMKYFHRPADSSSPAEWVLVCSGQMVYTPPGVEHAVEFLEDSEFLNITSKSRAQELYESDLVRVELLKPKETL